MEDKSTWSEWLSAGLMVFVFIGLMVFAGLRLFGVLGSVRPACSVECECHK